MPTITDEELKRLQIAEETLAALIAAGVDTWGWYSECIDNYIRDNPKSTLAKVRKENEVVDRT